MATVLVIDHTKGIQGTLRAILEAEGHAVHAASHGSEGVAYCEEHAIDVVLMDLTMPAQQGLETMRGLWAMAPSPKIIAIAGGRYATRLRLLEDAAALTADRILQQPIRARDLLMAVQELLAEI